MFEIFLKALQQLQQQDPQLKKNFSGIYGVFQSNTPIPFITVKLHGIKPMGQRTLLHGDFCLWSPLEAVAERAFLETLANQCLEGRNLHQDAVIFCLKLLKSQTKDLPEKRLSCLTVPFECLAVILTNGEAHDHI